MVKLLKRKFIFINMTLVGVVVFIMFLLICFFTYQASKRDIMFQLDESISRLEAEGSSSTDNGEGTPDLPYLNTIIVHTDTNGEIVEMLQGDTDFDAESIYPIINAAIERGDRGVLHSYGFIFTKRTSPSGSYIALTTTDPLIFALQNTVIICIFMSILTLVILLIASERLAHYAITPVSKAWDGQKQFVEDASHDLKTPLTVIMANNDILLSRTDSTIENERKWIESSREEAAKMKTLIEKMLDLAKSEAVNQSLEFKKVSLSELVESSVLELEAVAYEKNVTINAQIAKGVFLVTSRETYSKILETLIENAIKYSPSGSEIVISLKEDAKRISLNVTSFGEPIPPKDLEHIFERFYRTDKSRHTSGYGLGLAIAKNLSLSIASDLTVKSSSEGTTFSLLSKKKSIKTDN